MRERGRRVGLEANVGARFSTEEKCLLQHAPRLTGLVT